MDECIIEYSRDKGKHLHFSFQEITFRPGEQVTVSHSIKSLLLENGLSYTLSGDYGMLVIE